MTALRETLTHGARPLRWTVRHGRADGGDDEGTPVVFADPTMALAFARRSLSDETAKRALRKLAARVAGAAVVARWRDDDLARWLAERLVRGQVVASRPPPAWVPPRSPGEETPATPMTADIRERPAIEAGVEAAFPVRLLETGARVAWDTRRLETGVEVVWDTRDLETGAEVVWDTRDLETGAEVVWDARDLETGAERVSSHAEPDEGVVPDDVPGDVEGEDP